MLDFYNQLAEDYHLIFEDWDTSVKRQGRVLDQIIQNQISISPNNLSVLDCSCGIGTQAIGLALLGYNVLATDFSTKAVSRAKREAKRLQANLTFGVADFRTLSDQVKGAFNIIISCDNSLPHLLDDTDLQLALRNIWSKLSDNAFFLASIRDYDQLLKEKPRATTPKVFNDETGKRIVFQICDWGINENIGLAISDEIIKLHGGKIDVESNLGNSTLFIVSLPKRTLIE